MSQKPTHDTSLSIVTMFPIFFLTGTVSQTVIGFDVLESFETYWSTFYRMSLNRELVDLLVNSCELGLNFFLFCGGEVMGVMCHFY